MRTIIYILLSFFLFGGSLTKTIAQVKAPSTKLYTYPEESRAYEQLTRQRNGEPGKKYWQNSSKYKIQVSLIPETRQIVGSEKVTYTNNSPDSLNMIIIRTYPDFYKSTGVKDYTIDKEDSSNGMNISKITFDNDSTVNFRYGGTNIYINLTHKLPPHQELSLNISWDFFLPKNTRIREGTFFDSSFFVAYWYPQISVYDDIDGWDFYNYTGLQEFYNDFNDYDVQISLPSKYLVWATGDWLNSNEVLAEPYLTRYKQGLVSESVTHVIDSNSRKATSLTLKSQNTYHFVANSVSDFSFAASDTFLWDMISTPEKSKSNKVNINVIYHPSVPGFKYLAEPATKVIRYLADTWAGEPYPYRHLTLFSGDGGMEYAMMINQGYMSEEQGGNVMAHEITHTYFPFLVGTNERKYAWMDESFAQTLPNDMTVTVNQQSFKPQEINRYFVKYFESFIGTSQESPPMELSINLKGASYYFSAYTRPAFALRYLQQLLGDDLYKTCIREYIRRWKYKHPTPYDFFNTINYVSKKDLNWFWKPWFFDRAFPDVSIVKATAKNNRLSIVLKKIGLLPVPIEGVIFYNDGTSTRFNRQVDIWADNETVVLSFAVPVFKKVTKITINDDLIPDVNQKDNSYLLK